MKIVVLPPLVPPLKAISLLLAMNGVCSGNSTSTLVMPLPMIAFVQIASACFGVLRLQFARGADRQALGVDRAVLVGFDDDFFQRRRVGAVGGGDFAADVERDRRRLVLFGSAVGVKPPFRVRTRFPALTTVSGYFLAVAIPATATASTAPRASVVIKRLRMCSISLLLRPGRHSPGHRKPWSIPPMPKLPPSAI